MDYQPKPIDTTKVELDRELLDLVEELARNNHDVWAQGRFAEGWRHGAQRSDPRKEHPCLVPYKDLPESEKEYDRNTVIGALKAIIALGYKIHKA